MKNERLFEVPEARFLPPMRFLDISQVPIPVKESTLDPEQLAAMEEVRNAHLHGIATDREGNVVPSEGAEVVLIGPVMPDIQA